MESLRKMSSAHTTAEPNPTLCVEAPEPDAPNSSLSESPHNPVAGSVLNPEQSSLDLDQKPHSSAASLLETPEPNLGSQPEHSEDRSSVGRFTPNEKATTNCVGDQASPIKGADQECRELMEKFERLTELMSRQKILLADLALDDIEQRISKLDPEQLSSDVEEAIGKFRSNDAMKAIRSDAQKVRKMIREAQTKDPNWILSSEDNSRRMKSFHRVNNDSSIICFKVEARSIQCNVFNLLALFIEVDLLPAILSTPLASLDIDPLLMLKFRKLMHIVCTPIWPFSARDITLDMSGFDVLDQKCVVLCGESFEKADDVGISAPESPSKSTRISAQLSGVILRPLGENLTSMVVIAALDVKLGAIPPALVQFITKRLTLPIFQMFTRHAEKLSESQIHQERLSEDRFGVYETIRNALSDYDYEQSRIAEGEASSQLEDVESSKISFSHPSNHLATI